VCICVSLRLIDFGNEGIEIGATDDDDNGFNNG